MNPSCEMKPSGKIPVAWHRRVDDVLFRFCPAVVFGIGLTAVLFAWPEYDEVPPREPVESFSESHRKLTANSITQQTIVEFGQVD